MACARGPRAALFGSRQMFLKDVLGTNGSLTPSAEMPPEETGAPEETASINIVDYNADDSALDEANLDKLLDKLNDLAVVACQATGVRLSNTEPFLRSVVGNERQESRTSLAGRKSVHALPDDADSEWRYGTPATPRDSWAVVQAIEDLTRTLSTASTCTSHSPERAGGRMTIGHPGDAGWQWRGEEPESPDVHLAAANQQVHDQQGEIASLRAELERCTQEAANAQQRLAAQSARIAELVQQRDGALASLESTIEQRVKLADNRQTIHNVPLPSDGSSSKSTARRGALRLLDDLDKVHSLLTTAESHLSRVD